MKDKHQRRTISTESIEVQKYPRDYRIAKINGNIDNIRGLVMNKYFGSPSKQNYFQKRTTSSAAHYQSSVQYCFDEIQQSSMINVPDAGGGEQPGPWSANKATLDHQLNTVISSGIGTMRPVRDAEAEDSLYNTELGPINTMED